MRKTTLIILVCFLVLTSFKTPKNLIGHWKIAKIEVEGKQVDNLPIDWVAFKSDGIIEIGSSGMMSSGKWNYDEESKLVWTEIEKKKEYLEIQKLSKKKLTLKSGTNTMYLEKK